LPTSVFDDEMLPASFVLSSSALLCAFRLPHNDEQQQQQKQATFLSDVQKTLDLQDFPTGVLN
jgi:hypothetical protein